jgi:DNA-binding transcriptional LysR family regulator
MLGLRLLNRSRNGIQPTVYGRALVQRGMAIFDELKQGVEELEFLADPTKGELNIGSTESIAEGLLPAVIDRFSGQHSGVHLNVVQAVISTLHYRELRERSIDLLLGRIPANFAEHDLEADVLFNDQVVVVAGEQSRWARARGLTLADLADAPWILPPADTLPGSLAVDLPRRGSGHAGRTGHDAFNSPVLPSHGERTLRHHAADLNLALQWQEPGTEGTPHPASHSAAAGWCRDAEESHAKSSGTAFHRMCARDREAARRWASRIAVAKSSGARQLLALSDGSL